MNRKRKLEQSSAPSSMKLFEFLAKKKDKKAASTTASLNLNRARMVRQLRLPIVVFFSYSVTLLKVYFYRIVCH